MEQSKQKQHHADGFPRLPQEILFAILLHLPASFIWEVARCVCKSWYDIISDADFITAHFTKSKDVLLVKEYGLEDRMHYLEKVGRRFRHRMIGAGFRFPGRPGNSCRGLCIFLRMYTNPYNYFVRPSTEDLVEMRRLYVANPLTNQTQQLPFFLGGWINCFLLAYIEQTKVYKAICVWSHGSTSHLYTFSLGIDVNWRKLSYVPEAILKVISNLSSVSIGEFLSVLQSGTSIIAIDLHEETVDYIQFPHGNIFMSYGLQNKGDLLSCNVLNQDYLAVWTWNKTEWTELCKIYNPRPRTRRVSCKHGWWSPIGWLDNSTLIFSDQSRWFFWAYDVNTGERKVRTLNDDEFSRRLSLLHRNSLAKW